MRGAEPACRRSVPLERWVRHYHAPRRTALWRDTGSGFLLPFAIAMTCIFLVGAEQCRFQPTEPMGIEAGGASATSHACMASAIRAQRSLSFFSSRRMLWPAPHIAACKASPMARHCCQASISWHSGSSARNTSPRPTRCTLSCQDRNRRTEE